MPELPEVETIKKGLEVLLPGKVVGHVVSDWPKSFPNDKQTVDNFLVNSSIKVVRRRGKAILIDLSSGYSLAIHLKMTGQLVYKDTSNRFGGGHPTGSLIGRLPDKSTRVTIDFKDKSKLFFNDQRKFGWVRLLPTTEITNLAFFKKIGPEPLEANFTDKLFSVQLKRRPNSQIKAALLDQTVIAGIGNIYADESLWLAKIHPAERVKNLTPTKIKKMHTSIIEVLNASIKNGGSTDRNYVDAEGNKGSYLKLASVFRKDGQPCPRCGTLIIKTRVAGRGTHICLNCQRLKK
ncbi:MAG TPA: bifunctional DNA-formamidopyrimidine glycosylase/DNA-(apurinic or apyrimidinic site) lyase [Candidatus Saccharimonadales bacterium]|nr:bifunctional DNA-formamidopyrimidine glycosylase/DNA-(apurinic or apyrimidinic site) lyase [Candidatus Saccharimonadales bacterium]